MSFSNVVSAPRLLLVEDSVSFAHCIKAKLQKEVDAQIVLARSLAEAREAVRTFGNDFFLAILDLTLPDASGDEVVELASDAGIASIVFTGTYSDDLRDRLFELGAIDYLIKDSPQSLNYMAELVKRLRANVDTTALVVDDSSTSRRLMKALLEDYRFKVIEAANGHEAINAIRSNKDIRLILTDYNMPKMNGCELTKVVRQSYSQQEMAIIGLSSEGSGPLSARFLKAGANDFITKPFLREEFFCRITQNMNILDQVRALSTAALRDALTGLNNRRRFFDVMAQYDKRDLDEKAPHAIGMIDIDYFKSVNDSYGHACGDAALRQIGSIIAQHFGAAGQTVGRIGGEEFAVFLEDCDEADAEVVFEELRAAIEGQSLFVDGHLIGLSVSIGVCGGQYGLTETSLSVADQALYEAKARGRNCVVLAEPGEIEHAAQA